MTLSLPGPLVSSEWLARHLNDVVVLDATFTMPGADPDAAAIYAAGHIPGARFFDIETIADTASLLPHMVPSAQEFAQIAGRLGVADGAPVVVYDRVGLMSAGRAWWMLRLFGHENVAVLDGGLKAWTDEGRPVTTDLPALAPERFTPAPRRDLVTDRAAVLANVTDQAAQVIDARSAERFEGRVPEPRAGLRSGHIPHSRNLPFNLLSDPATGKVLPPEALRDVFLQAGVDLDRPIITSCGSGVTASALAFALALLGRTDVAVYDGSWSEWGQGTQTPVATGPAEDA